MIDVTVLFMAAAIGLGLCLGGKIGRLGNVEIPRLPFLLASFSPKLLPVLPFLAEVDPAGHLPLLISAVSFCLFCYSVVPSLSMPGFKTMAAGTSLNFAVKMVNGGRMPVSLTGLTPEKLDGELQRLAACLTHRSMEPGTRVKFLGDLFKLSLPGLKTSVFSVGDVLLAIGAAWFIVRVMLGGFPCPPVDDSIN